MIAIFRLELELGAGIDRWGRLGICPAKAHSTAVWDIPLSPLYSVQPFAWCLTCNSCYSFCPCMETAQMPSPFCLARQEAGPCPGRFLSLKSPDPAGWACSLQVGPGDSGTFSRAWLAPPTHKSNSPGLSLSSGSCPCGDRPVHTTHVCFCSLSFQVAGLLLPNRLITGSIRASFWSPTPSSTLITR